MIKAFSESLAHKISSGLPGLEAHKIMAPKSRPLVDFKEEDFPKAHKACVLLLFYPSEKEINIVLIKRPSYDGVHGGQVSFPGGKIEAGDPDRAFTALRECEEEIGVDKKTVQIFSRLSNIYIPPSNFFVFPILGYSESRPDFLPDPKEVEYIIETPVNILLDDSIKSNLMIKRPEVNFNAPCYIINKHRIWGATAMVLSELEFLLRR